MILYYLIFHADNLLLFVVSVVGLQWVYEERNITHCKNMSNKEKPSQEPSLQIFFTSVSIVLVSLKMNSCQVLQPH